MSKFKALFHPRYSPLFRMVIQTLVIFIVVIIPFGLNVINSPPPFSISNTGASGYSIFSQRLNEEGFNTTRTLLSTDPLLDLPPASILVIGGGVKDYRDSETAFIDGFLQKGGTILLLADSLSSRNLAFYLGVYLSSSNIMETTNYYKSPEVVMIRSPFTSPGINSTLALTQPKAITAIAGERLFNITTEKTAFIDANSDKKWSQYSERLREQHVAVVTPRRNGFLIVVSSPSFLSNDFYLANFGNINVTISMLKIFSYYFLNGSSNLVCFEESHKRWPVGSTDGLINQSYGTLILLTRTESFIIMLVLLILFLYYFTPRFKEIYKTKDSYKSFLSEHIWSRGREIYDTFGLPVKPTNEEQILSSLYFQHENYPNRVYNIYLQRKLNYVQKEKMTEKELLIFEKAVERQIDHKFFMFLFRKLEEIQKRRLFENED